MSKKSQLDKAIEILEGQVAVLHWAIAKLRELQAQTPARKTRARPVEVARPA